MTLEDFVTKNNGKKIDYDGVYGVQCVDLFRLYCKDVLNIPHTGGVLGAAELFTKYEKMEKEKKYFHKIIYAGGTPEAGDAVVFKATRNNKFGHVAIVLAADKLSLTVFEQDGTTQKGAYITEHSYNNVLGFLRKR